MSEKIAVIAIGHVIVNHALAVGAMPLVTALEWRAFRRRDEAWDKLAYKILLVCFVITTSVGALTGVGIWFSAALVNPAAIGSLIRVFFMAWLTEWVIFVAEVCLILAYYLTWNNWGKTHKRLHIGLGAVLSLSSWLTMAIIVAILGPVLIQRFWRCRPLSPGPARERIEALCRRAGLSYNNILDWPLFGGRMITAGVMGLVGRFRYILVTDALQENGFKPFTFFDFTPVGLIVMFSGIAFMALVGRHMLPRRDVVKESSSRRQDLSDQYGIQQHLFSVRIPEQSPLVNKTLAASRMHSAVGLNVIGITRADRTLMAPGPSEPLHAGDLLTVEGRIDNFMEVSNWNRLVMLPNYSFALNS